MAAKLGRGTFRRKPLADRMELCLLDLEGAIELLVQFITETDTPDPTWFQRLREARAGLEGLLSGESGVAVPKEDVARAEDVVPPHDREDDALTRRLAAAHAWSRLLEQDAHRLRATRMPSQLGPRAQANDAAYVQRTTGVPIDHEVWIMFASARAAQDEAAAQRRPEPVEEAAAALVGDDPDVQTARRWLEQCAAVYRDELPPADALADRAESVVSFLRRHHPQCRGRLEVAAAILSYQGWPLGIGTRRQRADALRHRLSRTRMA